MNCASITRSASAIPYEARDFGLGRAWSIGGASLGAPVIKAAMELDAAQTVFARLGAGPDLARVEALAGSEAALSAHGLTRRAATALRLPASPPVAAPAEENYPHPSVSELGASPEAA